MPRVLWPSGTIDFGETWEDVLERVRSTQDRDVPMEDFRAELGKRAWVWNRVHVDPSADARDFFQQLEWAKMLKILPDSATMKTDTTTNER